MKQKNIMILGATGMAGHMIYHYLKEENKHNLIDVVFRNKLTPNSILLDVHDIQNVEKIIQAEKPDYIINCIGVLIKGAQNDPANAIYVNSYFPHLLKKLSDKINAKVIHISTDCVFLGTKGNYSETDIPDATDIYGRSKALGEIVNNKDLTVRTSIIGPELKSNGEGLFDWFMKQRGQINGYVNAMWGGVTTLELAKAIDYIIMNDVSGLVHLSNGMAISKYDLLNKLKFYWKKDEVDIVAHDKYKVDKSIKSSSFLQYKVNDYDVQLSDLYNWMLNHPDLYIKTNS